MILKGTLCVEANDLFEKGLENHDDCFIGVGRSPLMFTGERGGDYVCGALELIIKNELKILFLDNHSVNVRIIIEPI